MAYATQDDLVPLRITLRDLVKLTDDTESDGEPGAGQVNVVTVNAALDKASAIVDGYLRQRYKTPLQLSTMVVDITLDIALYELFTRRRTTKPNETVSDRYTAALKLLRDIGSGSASLDQPSSAAAPQGSSAGPLVTSQPQRFDDCNLKGWA